MNFYHFRVLIFFLKKSLTINEFQKKKRKRNHSLNKTSNQGELSTFN